MTGLTVKEEEGTYNSFDLSAYSIFCTRFQNSYVITTIHSSTVYILPPHLSHKPSNCVTVSHIFKYQIKGSVPTQRLHLS